MVEDLGVDRGNSARMRDISMMEAQERSRDRKVWTEFFNEPVDVYI